MEIYSFITSILTIVCGGGWFINWRAKKRKENGEATQAEADGWAKQQAVYQKTIEDLDSVCEKIRESRDRLHDYNETLRKENEVMRVKYEESLKKYSEIETRMNDMDLQYKRDISRIGRRIDVLSPFLCGVAGCLHRKKVSLMENIDDNSFATSEERINNIEPSNDAI